MGVCALVAACDFNSADFRTLHDAGAFDSIVAVDGGYAHLKSIDCDPDFIIGDFDSLGYVPEGGNIERHPTRKDKSDLELALDHAADAGFQSVRIYGALGGRLDHSVANLQMCARFAESGVETHLVGGDFAVHVLVGPSLYDLPITGHGTVSVFSASNESLGVCEHGLEYPLDDAVLTNRTTLGLSNELTGQPASVSVKRGTLYIFHPVGV